MKLNELFTDDDAVSPVIGVILMVAITVILAAVIGTFVLGLGSQVQNNAPTTDFSFNEDSSFINVTHTSGQKVEIDNIDVTGEPVQNDPCTGSGDWGSSSEITAGDTCSLDKDGSTGTDHIDGAGTVRVTWESDDGSTSDTLAEYEYEP